MPDFGSKYSIKPIISDIYLNSKKNYRKIRLASIDQTDTSSAMKSTFLTQKSSILKIDGENRSRNKASMNRTMFVFPE
jgi:hypothetical protein